MDTTYGKRGFNDLKKDFDQNQPGQAQNQPNQPGQAQNQPTQAGFDQVTHPNNTLTAIKNDIQNNLVNQNASSINPDASSLTHQIGSN